MMNYKTHIIGFIVFLFVMVMATNVFSMEHSGGHTDSGMKGETVIPKGVVKGYTFEYQIMDMRENLKKMGGMNHGPKTGRTHHLMVLVKGPGKVAIGDVTYSIKGPDGRTVTVKAMSMGDSYGADISMPSAGAYAIDTRVTSGKNLVTHSFVYQMK